MTHNRVRIWILGVAVICLGIVFHQQIIGQVTYAVEKGRLEAGREDLAVAKVEALSDAFRQVARQVKPAVVRIQTTATTAEPDEEEGENEGEGRSEGKREGKGDDAKPRWEGNVDPEDLPEHWRKFFEEFGGLGGERPERPIREGTGSGVIIDATKGYVLTNNHVVGGAEEKNIRLDVFLADGRSMKAKIIGRDENTELALIQIEPERLHEAPLGDSEAMEVGDWVLAIGAPFGLEQTVTQGIVSAKGRNHVLNIGYQDFLQTDAAINPGNSGGPLVNMRGEVIGINTAIATNGMVAGYMGIGFSVPTRIVKHVLPYLKQGEEVVRGYLGVTIKGLEDEPGLYKTFGLKENRGVLIDEIHSDTPAGKAGLKSDDVILAYNDKKIETAAQLQELVAMTKPDTVVNLRVWRNREEMTIPVTIERQPKDFFSRVQKMQLQRPDGEEEGEETSATIKSLGMTVAQGTPALARRYGLDRDMAKDALIVTEVEPLGEARALGIRPGTVIASVQGKPMRSMRDLETALSTEALREGVRMRVHTPRGSRTLFLQIK